jgi:hypothetical protein
MDIGKPERVIRVEPLQAPADVPEPVQEPLRPTEPAEPVPTDDRGRTFVARNHRTARAAANGRSQ